MQHSPDRAKNVCALRHLPCLVGSLRAHRVEGPLCCDADFERQRQLGQLGLGPRRVPSPKPTRRQNCTAVSHGFLPNRITPGRHVVGRTGSGGRRKADLSTAPAAAACPADPLFARSQARQKIRECHKSLLCVPRAPTPPRPSPACPSPLGAWSVPDHHVFRSRIV
jgi:hypothetical protein